MACSHEWPPWQRGSCHSYEASLHFSLEPDELDCAPRGVSPHPGTCTSANTSTDTDELITLIKSFKRGDSVTLMAEIVPGRLLLKSTVSLVIEAFLWS